MTRGAGNRGLHRVAPAFIFLSLLFFAGSKIM
jgi:hypothetical protein